MEIERARKESAREREREMGDECSRKTNKRLKKRTKDAHEIRLLKCFKHAAY